MTQAIEPGHADADEPLLGARPRLGLRIERRRLAIVERAGQRHGFAILMPLAEIAPDLVDPVSGLTIQQLRDRLTTND